MAIFFANLVFRGQIVRGNLFQYIPYSRTNPVLPMKIGISLLVFAVLLFVAGGLFVAGIMLIAFSSDALQKIEEIPSWVQHYLIPIVTALLLTGALLPPLMLYFDYSWSSVASAALISFLFAIVAFCMAGSSILPSE